MPFFSRLIGAMSFKLSHRLFRRLKTRRTQCTFLLNGGPCPQLSSNKLLCKYVIILNLLWQLHGKIYGIWSTGKKIEEPKFIKYSIPSGYGFVVPIQLLCGPFHFFLFLSRQKRVRQNGADHIDQDIAALDEAVDQQIGILGYPIHLHNVNKNLVQHDPHEVDTAEKRILRCHHVTHDQTDEIVPVQQKLATARVKSILWGVLWFVFEFLEMRHAFVSKGVDCLSLRNESICVKTTNKSDKSNSPEDLSSPKQLHTTQHIC